MHFIFFSPPDDASMTNLSIFTEDCLIVGKPPSLQVHSKRCHFRILYAKCHYFHLAGDSILSRENCHRGIRGDNWKTVKGGSTSGLSRSCAHCHIPRDGRRGLRGVDYSRGHFVLLGGRRRRKKYIIIIKREQERGSASQSISCHRLSPDGWMMDDCIFPNNTKTLPLWGTFCTGRNFVPASVCVQRQLASPILFFVFYTLLTADMVTLHAGNDTWLEGQSVSLPFGGTEGDLREHLFPLLWLLFFFIQ